MDDNQEDNDGEERNSQSSIKQPRLKEGIQNQVKGKRRSAEFIPDSFSHYMDENLEIRNDVKAG